MDLDSKHGRLIRSFIPSLLAAVLLAGCGGGNSGSSLMPSASGVTADGGKAPAAGFALAEPGPDSIAGLSLDICERNDQVVISIIADKSLQPDAVLFELYYDATRYAPQVVQATDAFAPLSDSLCIEMLSTPGVVSFGQVSLASEHSSVAVGDVLANVLFTAASDETTVRVAADVPVHTGALCPLTYDSATGELKLYYANPGDYDQNGMVSASDLVPLGRNFGESGPFAFESALSVIDGNNNGQIEVADLTTIGQNWGHNVERYNFYASDEISDVPVEYAAPSTIEPLGSVEFGDALGNPVLDRLRFSFMFDAMKPFRIYWARPVAGEAEGIRSNLAGPAMVTQPGSTSNALPSAQLNLDYAGLEAPALVSLDASASSDLDGVIAFYEWDFEGDGLYDAFGTESVVTHVYTQAGTYAPLVRVTDNLGAWAIAQADPFTITAEVVPNTPPVADIVATIQAGVAPLAVGFMASGSSDSDGYIAKYEWDFDGDGVYDLDSGVDPTVIHTYSTAGTFTATVRVTDDRGDSDTDSVEITVSDPPPPNELPVAMLTADPPYGDAPLTVTLDASGSHDPDGSIVKYEWDFDGDGNFEEYGQVATTSHRFTINGIYPATVRVTDDGGASGSAAMEILANESLGCHGVWPSFGHDNRNTRRSPYVGAQTSDLKWTHIFGLNVTSSPAVASDGTVYVGCWNGKLYAFNPDRSLRWSYSAGSSVYSCATSAVDGLVVAGCRDGVLHVVNPDGSLKWTYQVSGILQTTPAIGDDGTIYFSSTNKKTYAIDPDGNLKWSFSAGWHELSAPKIDDGIAVYLGSDDGNLYALNLDGSQKWSYPIGRSRDTTPVIGADHSVYAGSFDGVLNVLNPDGSLKWIYSTGCDMYSQPAVSSDGTVYWGGGYDYMIHAINADGSLMWSSSSGMLMDSSPAIDSDGTVYMGCEDQNLYAYNPDGSLKWIFTMTGMGIEFTQAIGNDGTIYLGTKDGCFYAIKSDGEIKWSFPTLLNSEMKSSPTIDSIGTIYIGNDNGNIYAINTDGSQKWSYSTGAAVESSAAIGADGAVYFGSNDNNLYAINSDGSLKWSYLTEGSVRSSPLIAQDGTVYVGSDDCSLYSIRPDGSLNWSFPTLGSIQSSPVLGADGTVYFGSDDKRIYAISSAGHLEWEYATNGAVVSSPAISEDGTVYVGSDDNRLYAFYHDGNLKWQYITLNCLRTSPAIAVDGTVYVGSLSQDNRLFAIRPDGSLKWSFSTLLGVSSSPVIDANGVVYFGSFDDHVYALTPEGSLKWSFDAKDCLRSSPAIGLDGTVYVGCDDGMLYAFGPGG